MTTSTAARRADASRADASRAAARWLLAVAVVLGVLGMHALVGPTGDMAAETSVVAPADSAADDHTQHHDAPADHAPTGGHSVLMTCLAVLGSLAAPVLLVTLAARWLVARWSVADATPAGRRRRTLPRLGRPPPWTVPSLHQLSLLRV